MSQSSPKSHKRAAPATSLQADTTAKRVAAHQESHSYALPSELTVAAKEEYEFEDALPSPQTETCGKLMKILPASQADIGQLKGRHQLSSVATPQILYTSSTAVATR